MSGLSAIRRLSYLVPALVVAGLAGFTAISWWAVAMVLGGLLFCWDWLWGDNHLRQPRWGLLCMGLGVAGLMVSYGLARQLGVGMAEFLSLASGLERRVRWLYNLPAISVGAIIYGALIFVQPGG